MFGGISKTVVQKAIYKYDISNNSWELFKPKGHGESPDATSSNLHLPVAGLNGIVYGTKIINIGGQFGSEGICAGIIQMDQLFDTGVDPLLSSYLKSKKDSGLMADVIFQTKDSKGNLRSIKGHKCIIAQRCKYLSKLFDEFEQHFLNLNNNNSNSTSTIQQPEEDLDDIEALQRKLDAELAISEGNDSIVPNQLPIQEIEINDYSFEVLDAFLDFIYTGKFKLNGSENVKSLVKLATTWDTYSETISKICSVESVYLNLSVQIQDSMEKDMQSLINNSKYSDLTLKVGSEGKLIPAHKILLCRSPYFTSMLTSGMKESSQSIIEFENMHPEALIEILKFIYTVSLFFIFEFIYSKLNF